MARPSDDRAGPLSLIPVVFNMTLAAFAAALLIVMLLVWLLRG